jgi:ligand-binding sensor domain-containing protein
MAVTAFVVVRFVLPNLTDSTTAEDQPPPIIGNGEIPPPVELPPLFSDEEEESEPTTAEFATILRGRDPIPATDTSDLQWTTWSFANEVTRIAIHGDELVAGATGNLTIWDRRDGTLLHQFTLNDGLPGPQVNALWVDLDGTLWVGADSGLGRFDPESQQWQHYDESDGLEQQIVRALLRTSGGAFLIGTLYGSDGDGLVLFDGEEFTRFPGFPSGDPAEGLFSNTVSTLFEDGSGNLWVGNYAGQVGRFDGDEWTIYSADDTLPVGEIRDFTLDATGRLWVGTDIGTGILEGESFQPVTTLPGNNVFGLFTDSQGNIWVNGAEPSIMRYDPATEEWQEYANDYSYSAAEDPDGNVYLATGSGLMRVDGDELTPWLVPNVPRANYYERILPTPDGDLLFVADLYTSALFDPETETWTTLPDLFTDLPCCAIPRAYDSQGRLWATEAGRVWILTDDQPLTISGEHGLPTDAGINDVAFYPDGGAAIATEAGLALWDGETIFSVRTAEDGSGMISNNVTAVLITTDESGESTTWLGTEGGLSRIAPDHTWTHYTVGDPFGSNFQYISDLAQAPDGTIWVATEGDINGDGLYRFEADDIDHFFSDDGFSQIGSDHIYTLHIAPDGSLWFTPSYNGAVHYDGQTWTAYDTRQNILMNDVTDAFVDDAGTVWFSASFGIVRFRP